MNDNQFTPPSSTEVYRQVKNLGVTKSILKRVVLPSWRDDSLLNNSTGLVQFAQLLSKRLGINMEVDKRGAVRFISNEALVKFKKRSSTNENSVLNSSFILQSIGNTLINILKYNEKKSDLESLSEKIRNIKKWN